MAKRVTIRDVARLAGVAVGTASRVLARNGSVSADAVARVQSAASTLGYEPDPLAQSMRTRTTRAVGCLVPDISNPLYASIVNALEEALQTGGYTLLLANTRNDEAREASLLATLRRRHIDGIVIAPCVEAQHPALASLVSARMPLVVLDRDVDLPVGCVLVDHRGGALQATRHLLALGHRRIALLTPGAHLRPGRTRIDGYRDAHLEFGLAPDDRLVCLERSSMDPAFNEMLQLLSMPRPPTAAICLGTRMLGGVLKAVRHTGRQVPADFSIISVGDTDLSRLGFPPITTVGWDLDEVGRAAARLLLDQLGASGPGEAHRVVLTTDLILRESCAAPGLPSRAAP